MKASRADSDSSSSPQTTEPAQMQKRLVDFPTVNLGALQTTFEPARFCSSIALALSGSTTDSTPTATVGSTTAYSTASGSFYQFAFANTCSNSYLYAVEDCFPSSFAEHWNSLDLWTTKYNRYPVFAPATACPEGYEPMCTFTATTSTPPPATPATLTITDGTPIAFASVMEGFLKSGEQATGCCPSGYYCNSGLAYGCYSYLSAADTVVMDPEHQCGRSYHGKRDLQTFTVPTDVAEHYWALVEAPAIVLVNSQTTATESSTPSTSSSTISSSTGSQATPTSATSQSHGLSTGAKAAIGVAIPLGVIAIGLVLFFLLRFRKSQKAEASPDQTTQYAAGPQWSPGPQPSQVSQWSPGPQYAHVPQWTPDAQQAPAYQWKPEVQEAPSTELAAELDSTQVSHTSPGPPHAQGHHL